MELNKNATVIITTHNREKYLRRSLSYYLNFDLNLIVCDSSEKVFDFSTYKHNGWKYIHSPGMPMADKIYRVLESVETGYTVICADDDFVLLNAINECINFLSLNKEYVCATGYITTFVKDGQIPYFKSGYTQLLNEYKIPEENASDRLSHMLSNYFPTFYAVHRTDSLKKTFMLMKENPKFLEMTQSLATAINGKIKALSVFYGVWEGIFNSAGQVYTDFYTLSTKNIYRDEYNLWLEDMSAYLMKCEGCSSIEAKNKIQQAVSLYIEAINGTIYLKLKRVIKKCSLARLINFKVKLKLLKKQETDNLLYQKGFPLYDENTQSEFKLIKETILNHEC